MPYGIFRLHPEEVIEGAADRDHPEIFVQREQGFAHRVDDALREFESFICGFLNSKQFYSSLFQARFHLLTLGDVLHETRHALSPGITRAMAAGGPEPANLTVSPANAVIEVPVAP